METIEAKKTSKVIRSEAMKASWTRRKSKISNNSVRSEGMRNAWITRKSKYGISGLKKTSSGKTNSFASKASIFNETVNLPQKEKIRNILVNLMTESAGKILTLPAEGWVIEKKIIQRPELNKLTFYACEWNPSKPMNHTAIINRMRAVLAHDNVLKQRVLALIEEPIGNLIKGAEEGEYAHALLDYCGTFPTYEQEIEMALAKNIVKINGLVFITLTGASRVISGIIAKDCLIEMLGKYPNYKIERIDHEKVYEYQDPKPGHVIATPMVAMIVRRMY